MPFLKFRKIDQSDEEVTSTDVIIGATLSLRKVQVTLSAKTITARDTHPDTTYLTLPQERPLPVVLDPPVHVPQLVVPPEHEHFVRVLDLVGTNTGHEVVCVMDGSLVATSRRRVLAPTRPPGASKTTWNRA